MGFYGLLWASMGFYGLLWASVDGGTEGQTDDRTEGGTDRQMELVLDWKRVREAFNKKNIFLLTFVNNFGPPNLDGFSAIIRGGG